MHAFRLDIVRRLVAAFLVAALGATLVPAVGAQGATPTLDAVLDDAEAFEAALEAARDADAGSDRLAVFAEAYAAAVGDVSAEALAHLLGQSSLSGVLPPVHDEAVAAAKVAGPTASSAAAPLAAVASADLPVVELALGGEEALPARRAAAPSSRPRAP